MPVVDVNLMTQAQYARHRGCSKQAVSRAVAGERIRTFGADKLVDPELADVQWQRNTRVRASNRPATAGSAAAGATGSPAGIDLQQPAAAVGAVQTPAPGLDYHAARTLRENNEAQLAGLRLAEQRGDLVRVDEVRHSLAKHAIAFREGLLQMPARLSAVLAAETDPTAVFAALDAEIRATLINLTDAI